MHKLKVGDKVRIINQSAYAGAHGTIVARINKSRTIPQDYYQVLLDLKTMHVERYIRVENCVLIEPFLVWSGKYE